MSDLHVTCVCACVHMYLHMYIPCIRVVCMLRSCVYVYTMYIHSLISPSFKFSLPYLPSPCQSSELITPHPHPLMSSPPPSSPSSHKSTTILSVGPVCPLRSGSPQQSPKEIISADNWCTKTGSLTFTYDYTWIQNRHMLSCNILNGRYIDTCSSR